MIKAQTIKKVYLTGYRMSVPPAGNAATINVADKFGKKARVRSILVRADVAGIFMTLKKVGGGESIVESVDMGTLKQDRPVPLVFDGGDYTVQMESTRADTVTVPYTLIVEYI